MCYNIIKEKNPDAAAAAESEKIMNKRDIIAMCLDRMIANEQITNGVELHYAIAAAYADCKYAAAKAGYIGACFDDLWHKACTEHERKLNIRGATR